MKTLLSRRHLWRCVATAISNCDEGPNCRDESAALRDERDVFWSGEPVSNPVALAGLSGSHDLR
jgi:hypothetical protein